MPMVLERWPSREDLGPYYDIWLKMGIAWVLVTTFYEEEEWYLELERVAKRYSTSSDGIRDMVSFFEIFYHGLAMYDWQLHRLVRETMRLF